MNLKCIGGKCDNQIAYCDDNLKVGDIVRVNKPMKFGIYTFQESLETCINTENMTVSYYLYRKCVFHFSKDDYYFFLVTEGWTDKQAILYQFSKCS